MDTGTNASNLTFGVEFETVIPFAAILVGRYHNGLEVDSMPGWKVEHDSSIQCPAGYESAEFVSPVLKGADGLREVIKMIEYIKSIGGKVNPSCGFHVHVGWGEDTDGQTTAKLVKLVSYYEKGLYAATGTKSRENGSYCKSVRGSNEMCRKYRDGHPGGSNYFNRYSVLNLTNLSQRPAVEFRLFSATLNPTKAIGFICMALGMAEEAITLKRAPKWEPGDDAITRKGNGKAELNRLMKGIGWVKGNRATPAGYIEAEGIPALDKVRTEMNRLAAKYDGAGEDE